MKKILLASIIASMIIVPVAIGLMSQTAYAVGQFRDLQSFYRTTLTASVSSSATTLNVSTAPSVNTAFLILESNTANQEIVLMTSRSGTQLTVIRGLNATGTSETNAGYGKPHSAGTKVEIADVHYYIKQLQDVLAGSTSTPAGFIVGTDLTAGSSTVTNLFSTTASSSNFIGTNATITNATSTNIYVSILDVISAIINSLTVGNLTATSSASIATTTFTGTPSWSGTPTSDSHLATKKYADDLVLAGAPDADEVTKGNSELATKAEASLGTSVGGTSARLVLPASMATSSSQVATTSVVVTNTSGKIDPSFLNGAESYVFNDINILAYGDGSDGDVTIAGGSTTTLTRDAYYNNLTINGALVPAGFTVYVKGTLSGSGSISYNGTNGSNGGNSSSGSSAGSAGAGGSTSTTGYLKNTAGTDGGAGGTHNTSGSASLAGITGYIGTSTASTGGIGNGQGTNPDPGAGGSTTTISKIGTDLFYTLNVLEKGNISAPFFRRNIAGATGGAGANGYANTGGGGAGGGGGGGAGSSGGIIVILAKTWAGSFNFYAIGGNGGNGGNGYNGPNPEDGGGGGGGAGGNGGSIVTIYGTKSWNGNYYLSGGTGGTGGLSGASVQATSGGNGNYGSYYEVPMNSLIR